MPARVLEKALAMCSGCERRPMCQRISQVVSELQQESIHVWDVEYRLRFKALLKELDSLGFDFPDGWHRCQISRMQRPEIMVILREAQVLLLEIRASAQG